MRELWILCGFFLAVMTATAWMGYIALFSGQTDDDGASAVAKLLRRLGTATPPGAAEAGRLRQRLVLAGYRQPSAEAIYSGIRVGSAGMLALLCFSVTLFNAQSLYRAVLGGACAAMCGFLLPNRILDRRIRRRSQRLRSGLPAALDLLVLSLEAGQLLDAALLEASRQLRTPFPELDAELSLVQLEMFAGKSRADAFRHLAGRTTEVEVRRLAQVFIDCDRFGTSLAPALRSHVHYLRLRMKQEASEAAGKVGVKLVFPVFFLIFPSVLLVTMGPAVLEIVSQLGPLLTGAGP